MTPNEQFETELTEAARKNLHSDIDVDRYVADELNEMWDGETYRDQDGDLYYHEISKHMTHHGQPFVVYLTLDREKEIAEEIAARLTQEDPLGLLDPFLFTDELRNATEKQWGVS